MLSAGDVAPYLIARGLLAPAAIVAGDCEIRDASRRHANWAVRAGGAGYLLKQGGAPERAAAIAHEAGVYDYLWTSPANVRLRRFLPAVAAYDPAAGVLAIRWVAGARRFGSDARSAAAQGAARTLGTALGRLHRANATVTGGPAAAPPPAVLRLHRPDPDLYRNLSQAGVQLVRVLQEHAGFAQGLEALAAAWRPLTLVHGDLKWENLLLARHTPGRRPQLTIVDWEMACAGDPCWDVGAICGEYLQTWLGSIPLAAGVPPDAALARARIPLARLQPAVRAFWAAYLQRLAPPDAAARLLRATGYAAARLIQTALEQAQTAVQLSGLGLLALQVALNILQRPHEAAVHLLGLPWPESHA